ncbi:hypothetical protein CASFOL_020136 [Castilleja foliolosa]|uniref:Uncharacterized protein n=1 Tax=Castilleja foliolosa TaxID=1961234 RepID=A0ABD3D2S7_9LAMI
MSKKLYSVLDEVETLNSKVRHQLDELEKANTTTQQHQFDVPNKISSNGNRWWDHKWQW